MLNQLYRYSSTFAKIKAMQSNLLTMEDYEQLLSKKTVSEISSYLKQNTNYKKVLSDIKEGTVHRGQLEIMLLSCYENEFIKIMQFEKGNNRKFLQIYFLRYEIESLKKMVRMLETGTLSKFSFDLNSYFVKFFTIDIEKLITSTGISQFIENLKGSVYYDILSPFIISREHLNIFSIEIALDVYYFKMAWRYKEKFLDEDDKNIVTNTLGSEVDLLNIMWILRCKKYFNTPNEIIYSFLLPMKYKLSTGELKNLVECEAYEKVLTQLQKTHYKDIFVNDDMFLEQFYFNFVLKNMQKYANKYPYSIMTVLNYLHKMENEVTNITKIIEGIRYNINPSEIRKYLIVSGGDIVVG